MTSYFAGVAADLKPFLAYIPSSTLTGIVWSDTEVVTGPMPFGPGRAVTVRVDSREVDSVPRVYGRQLPLAALESSRTSSLKGARRAVSLPHVGDWMMAVWQMGGEPGFAAANFRQLTETACGPGTAREIVSSLPLRRAMIGGGIFNMDGELLAVILPCNDHIAAIDPASVDALLEQGATLEQRLLGMYGVLFAPLSEGEARYFKDVNGLFVREVWNDTPAESAGLWPGDVLTGVSGQPVVTIEDLRALASGSEMPFDVRVQRAAKTLSLALRPVPTAAVGHGGAVTDAGLVLESAPKSYRIESILRDGPAARAGIQPGDRLVRINRAEPRSAEQVMRAMTAEDRGPLLLEIERAQRRIAVVIP
jgi:S1-C subfamily serine protease